MKLPTGWERISPTGIPFCRLRLRHADGWEARRLSSPEAAFPWCLVDPGLPGCVVVAGNGRGFLSLAFARSAHAAIRAGHCHAVRLDGDPVGVLRAQLIARGGSL